MQIYLSHSTSCTGWDLDTILEGTIFSRSGTTNRLPPYPEIKKVEMLDWDFKNPNWLKHKILGKKYNFEVVMAPDIFLKKNVEHRLKQVKQLQQYCKRVVLPVHYYDNRLRNYELALPISTSFSPEPINVPIWQVRESITHLLGGSPQKQLDLMKYFPNVESVDGNVLFRCAVEYGKYWKNESPYWFKPERELSNEVIFAKSITNVDGVFQHL